MSHPTNGTAVTENIDDNEFMDDFKDEHEAHTNQSQQTNNSSMNKMQIKHDETETFDTKVRNYLSKHKTKVYILTPCYGSLCYVNYVLCLMATVDMFRSLGIEHKVEFCRNDSLVSRARNNLVAKAMNDPDMTHIMFIDADITWDPIDLLKLIVANKALSGGVYPLKHYYWEKIVKDSATKNTIKDIIDKKNNSQFKHNMSDEQALQCNLLRYNINYLNNTLSIESNLAKVRHLATGFMMIQRKTIEQMSKAFPSTKYTDDVGFLTGTENNFAYALFDCGVEDNHYYSEDWLFCHRWTKMGGSIWIDVTINLMHTGNEDFKGCYLSTIL
jgi:acyl-CoA synthetase (AMP-forming)/AMP-acid ligase II